MFSKSEKEFLDYLYQVFNHLYQENIKIKLSKCDFFKNKIHYLRYLLSQTVYPLPEITKAIKSMPPTQMAKTSDNF